MDMLARQLSVQLGRPVLNQTDLKGGYDIDLAWAPDGASPQGAPPPPGVDSIPTAALDAPSLITAIQDVGLKLNSQRVTVDTIVIESAQRPSAN